MSIIRWHSCGEMQSENNSRRPRSFLVVIRSSDMFERISVRSEICPWSVKANSPLSPENLISKVNFRKSTNLCSSSNWNIEVIVQAKHVLGSISNTLTAYKWLLNWIDTSPYRINGFLWLQALRGYDQENSIWYDFQKTHCSIPFPVLNGGLQARNS